MAIPSTQQVSLSLRLGKALNLAKAGRAREAEETLSPDGRVPEDPVLLHALAALVTSTEDYSRAIHLWHLLLQKEPGHPEALRMIDSIDLWTSRPYWYRYLPGCTAVAATLIVGLIILASLGGGKPQPAYTTQTQVVQPVPAQVYQPTNYTPARQPAATPSPSYQSSQSSSPGITITLPQTAPRPAKKR